MKRFVRRRGFTLIELLVVTAIITVVGTLILIDNNRFGGQVLLEDLAYQVALTVRQAQTYGIAVQRFGSGNFSTGYGLHFAMSSPTLYILFADVDGTGLYDPSQNEVIAPSPYNLQQGYSITGLCAVPPGGSTCNAVTSIDILFKRPEPNAYISINGVSAITSPATIQQSAQVQLTSPKGNIKTVVVQATGQIYVQ